MRLDSLIHDYLLAKGYRPYNESIYFGLWNPPDSDEVMSFDWAIRDCREREGLIVQIEDFLAEQ